MKRNAFTLIEVLVVIVIILILLGIGAGIGQWQARRAEQDNTRVALKNLNNIGVEMQALGMAIGGGSLDTTREIATMAKNTRSLQSMLDGIPENLLGKDLNNDGDFNDANEFSVWDAWGNEIFFAKDGTALSGAPPRGDGIFYFASRGPDGQWGNYAAAAGSTAKIQEGDNLYSYEVN